MEASNRSGARAASWSGQLRSVPTALRRLLGGRAGVPGAARAGGRRPVLPAGRRLGRGRRLRFGQHAAETTPVPVSAPNFLIMQAG